MTTLTSISQPAAPAFRVASPLHALRGLVVFLLSATIAAAFILDVAGAPRAQPKAQVVQQALYLT